MAALPLDPVPDVVPVAVLPEDVLPVALAPPFVSEGTPVSSVGTPLDSVGTPLESVGTPLENVGTAGTVGPAEFAVPPVEALGDVTTVVTPLVAEGVTPVPVRPAVAPVVTVVVVGVAVFVVPVADDVPIPVTIRGAPPSGTTQFTSRFEQKSGIVVRSVGSAANTGAASRAPSDPARITVREGMALSSKAVVRVMLQAPGRRSCLPVSSAKSGAWR